jgi:hyaluronan synthase
VTSPRDSPDTRPTTEFSSAPGGPGREMLQVLPRARPQVEDYASDESESARRLDADLGFGLRQADGLQMLQVLATPTRGDLSRERVSSLRGSGDLRVRGAHRRHRAGHPTHLAPEETTPGALASAYDLPRVTYSNKFVPWLVCVSVALVARMVYHAYSLVSGGYLDNALLTVLVLFVAFAVLQQFLSWTDRPRKVTAAQQDRLNALRVVVAVPVYNEDPDLLDRAIWSLANSSRPPNVVHVVEDGAQKPDYRALREHWTRMTRPGFQVIWTRKPVNQGKKWAQSVVFCSHPEADVFITIDSDTSLERDAVHEGLKPFADPAIMSVAGIEVMYNARVSWLTRSVASRNIVYQLVTWGAQSAVGDTLVNRGTYALYRAEVIREIVPAYLEETFLGRPIKLGDDAALALFARGRGRTVQQVSAFSLPMCAETFSHHFRQFTRWMRGKVIRDEWRLRYLPISSYGWLYTVLTIFGVVTSSAVAILTVAFLPATAWLLSYTLAALIFASLATGTRVFCIKRSDENFWQRIIAWLVYPSAQLWVLFVLRPLRFYGAITWYRQGWNTRQTGVEVELGSHGRGPEQGEARESVWV